MRSLFIEDVVEEGYAQAYPYDPNAGYEECFEAAEADVKTARLGI